MIEKKKSLAIGSDHAGFKLKEKLIVLLNEKSYDVNDCGTYSEESADYPDFAHKVAEDIENGNSECGILICGTGNGVCMTANKHNKIRAALCWNAEIAILARKHNDANIVCIPARFICDDVAENIVKIFIEEKFEGGRHKIRIDKIPLIKCNK